MNNNSISADKRFDDQAGDDSSQLKKPKSSGMQIKSKVSLIISLSTVTLLKMLLP